MRQQVQKWWPLAFFLLGFLYDVLTLSRIDSVFGILKQGLYLGLVAYILGLEVLAFKGKYQPKGWMLKAWGYQEHAIHFFLGSLLSEYTLFFFTSASLWTSLMFVSFLVVILVINEFKRFHGDSGVAVRATLFSLCLISYFIYLIPVLIGFIGTIPFLLSLFAASTVAYGLARLLNKKVPGEKRFIIRQLLAPYVGIVALFSGLYFAHLVPPVPIAVKYMGLFHDIKKEGGKYLLGYTRPWWRFWERGDQTFLARPEDKLFCFVRIFSPSRFSDQIQIRWLFKEGSRGWQRWDAIPVKITGGREEGFRGFTVKSNYQPGDWQVRVETNDGREVGRIYFTVVADASQEIRPVYYENQ